MRALRFHRSLYSEAAIQTAMRAFDGFGRFQLTSEESYLLVQIEAREGTPEDELARELANAALAHTIEEKRA